VLGQLGESSFLRATVVLTIFLAIQTSVLTQIRPRRGLRVAFTLGLGFDLMVGTAFGIKALAYAIVAFSVSLLPYEQILSVRPLTRLTLGVAGGLAATLEVLLAGLAGRENTVTLRVTLIFAVVAVADALLASIAVRLMRWCLMVGDRPRL
jgi:rod shape-determining protein MreD